MDRKKFMEEEVPRWIAEGLVSVENGQLLLQKYKDEEPVGNKVSFGITVFSILGLLLLLLSIYFFSVDYWTMQDKAYKYITASVVAGSASIVTLLVWRYKGKMPNLLDIGGAYSVGAIFVATEMILAATESEYTAWFGDGLLMPVVGIVIALLFTLLYRSAVTNCVFYLGMCILLREYLVGNMYDTTLIIICDLASVFPLFYLLAQKQYKKVKILMTAFACASFVLAIQLISASNLSLAGFVLFPSILGALAYTWGSWTCRGRNDLLIALRIVGIIGAIGTLPLALVMSDTFSNIVNYKRVILVPYAISWLFLLVSLKVIPLVKERRQTLLYILASPCLVLAVDIIIYFIASKNSVTYEQIMTYGMPAVLFLYACIIFLGSSKKRNIIGLNIGSYIMLAAVVLFIDRVIDTNMLTAAIGLLLGGIILLGINFYYYRSVKDKRKSTNQ